MTPEETLRVAVVGAGPAGFYASGHLLAADRPVEVDLFDRLPTPFGAIDWSREAIGAAIKSTAAKHGLKASQIMMAVRALVACTLQTPSIDAILALLGRETVRQRMNAGLHP